MNDLVLIRGFDLFFENLSDASLENIARQLGGRYSFSLKQRRATYMFERIATVEHTKIGHAHELADTVGNMFAATYGCTYLYNELYITASVPTLPNVQAYIM